MVMGPWADSLEGESGLESLASSALACSPEKSHEYSQRCVHNFVGVAAGRDASPQTQRVQ